MVSIDSLVISESMWKKQGEANIIQRCIPTPHLPRLEMRTPRLIVLKLVKTSIPTLRSYSTSLESEDAEPILPNTSALTSRHGKKGAPCDSETRDHFSGLTNGIDAVSSIRLARRMMLDQLSPVIPTRQAESELPVPDTHDGVVRVKKRKPNHRCLSDQTLYPSFMVRA